MFKKKIIKKLNRKQKKAVLSFNKNLLILAGAGSGKTRVLIYRIIWLLKIKNFSYKSIIAVTFTNKSAEEIFNRINKFKKKYNINININKMWIGTFHSLANKLLKIHYKKINLSKNFQIINNEDQIFIIKKIIIFLKLNIKYNFKKILNYINKKKNKGISPILNKLNKNNIFEKIYFYYQKYCNNLGLIDFPELILLSYELWINNPKILNIYILKFKNILIDEFQDINNIQYNWIKLLFVKNNNYMLVGDDDQLIYSWRGATINNINKFFNEFPKTKIIKLEQNYRSTKTILKVANSIISNNNLRIKKKLWTNRKLGKPIEIYCANNNLEEAKFVVNYINILYKKGFNLNSFAILYRNNYQSKIIEKELILKKLKYKIYKGINFFCRQEIKYILSYLKIIINKNDDIAFKNIINTPSRGIGKITFKKINKEKKKKKISLFNSLKYLFKKKKFTKNINNNILNFLNLINFFKKKIEKLPLYKFIKIVIIYSGIYNMYKKKNNEKTKIRLKNLKELIITIKQIKSKKKNNFFLLKNFLSNIYFEENENKNFNKKEYIKIMTIHSSKGMEFPYVFIIGMEDGIFPNEKNIKNKKKLEEERRLIYVGITRTINKLILSYNKKRFLYGKEIFLNPSRFIKELPKKYIKKIKNNKFNKIKIY